MDRNQPEWLRLEVGAGLQRLFVLRLPSAPFTSEELIATAQVWLDALLDRPIIWTESLDRGRLRNGFASLITDCERWPSPKQLLERMGPRLQPLHLPAPPLTPEKRAQNLKLLEKMRTHLTDKGAKQ